VIYLKFFNFIRAMTFNDKFNLTKVEEAKPESIGRVKETLAQALWRNLCYRRELLKANPHRVGYHRSYTVILKEIAEKMETLYFNEPTAPELIPLFNELALEGRNSIEVSALTIRHLLDLGQKEKALGLFRPIAKVFPHSDLVLKLSAHFPEISLQNKNQSMHAVFSQPVTSVTLSPEAFQQNLVSFNQLCDAYSVGTFEEDLLTYATLNETLSDKEFIQEKIDFWLLKANMMNAVETAKRSLHLFRKLLVLGNGDPAIAESFNTYLGVFRSRLETELLKNGQETEFAALYDLILEHTFVGPKAMLKRVEIYYRIGMYVEAKKLLLDALDLYPKNLDILIGVYGFAKKMDFDDLKIQVPRLLKIVRQERPWDYAAQADLELLTKESGS
jgi:tetratricopeptide (TPR) repeat protein